MTEITYPYKVSVLMPVYNAEKYLREAIDSILNQTISDYEFLIIDDGSTDSTADIVKSYSDNRIKFIQNEKNEGLIYTLNKGLDLCQGQYIARMDGDDISLPDRFEKQVAYLDHFRGVSILGCAFSYIGTPHEIHFPRDDERIRIRLLECSPIVHPGVMMRASVLKDLNLRYDSRFKHAEDYQLWTQCAMKGLELGNLDDVLLQYRQHENQISVSKQTEQESIKSSIKFEFLSFYFDKYMSEEELMLVYTNANLIDSAIAFNKLDRLNQKYVFFKPPFLKTFLIDLLYKKNKSQSFLALDILRMLKNNVSFAFITAVIKIKLKR